MKRLGILVFEGVNVLDLAGPMQVFATASEEFEASGKPAAYELLLISSRGGIVRSSAGPTINAMPLSSIAPGSLDTLVVCGGHGAFVAAKDEDLIAWFQAIERRTPRIASICTGAFLLASAGFLEGRRATTHWNYVRKLAAEFPGIRLEPDAIYVEDGKFWTSAGVTAGLDMALAMVEADLGHSIALATARRLVFYLRRPGGQSQFSAHLDAMNARPTRLQKSIEWILNHPKSRLTAAEIASVASMSERSMRRAFKSSLGATPAQFVRRSRIEVAKRLLEQTDDRLERIAHESGFGTTLAMDRAFRRDLQISASAYRERFCSTARNEKRSALSLG